MADVLYGFFRNDCVYESAAALVSLHRTKRGAWQAMRAAKLAAAMEERQFGLFFAGKWWMRRKTLEDKWYGIQPVSVLP